MTSERNTLQEGEIVTFDGFVFEVKEEEPKEEDESPQQPKEKVSLFL